MQLIKLVSATALVLATALAAPASNLNEKLAVASDCPKATRYACGEYKLQDGSTQDFVSQVYQCIPRGQFICHKFEYAAYSPTHAGEYAPMIAAKVDPGCTCTFYISDTCDSASYKEDWPGWEGEPGKPEWSRPAYTDKGFRAWWCYEAY
ncbi:hypothetical protein ACEQ8H_007432 [Pleosporales sp. CAS-2024a]